MRHHSKLVIYLAFALTIGSGASAAAIALSYPHGLPPAAASLYETLMNVFVLGTGTIIGLLGGQKPSDHE